ncbi:MAG TPA: ribosome silencing factor [Pyrinomonadaceae bacterium]|jgi:ribosome-associated protein
MEQTLKEKSLQHDGTVVAEAQAEPADVLDERLIGALRAASDKKAVNSLVLDLREVTEFTDFFIITNGTNVRQVQAIADGISEDLKLIDARPIRIEGYNTAEWILMDYGDFVVHIFEEKSREFFDLERLWRDAKRVQIPENL